MPCFTPIVSSVAHDSILLKGGACEESSLPAPLQPRVPLCGTEPSQAKFPPPPSHSLAGQLGTLGQRCTHEACTQIVTRTNHKLITDQNRAANKSNEQKCREPVVAVVRQQKLCATVRWCDSSRAAEWLSETQHSVFIVIRNSISVIKSDILARRGHALHRHVGNGFRKENWQICLVQ